MPPAFDEYVYTKIIDINTTVDRINVYGVLQSVEKESTLNEKGKYHAMIYVVDETCPRGQSFRVHIYSNVVIGHLIVGSILRFHRLKVEKFNDVFDGRVFRETDVVIFPLKPTRGTKFFTKAENIQFTPRDEKRIEELRKFSCNRQNDSESEADPFCESQSGRIYFRAPGSSKRSFDQVKNTVSENISKAQVQEVCSVNDRTEERFKKKAKLDETNKSSNSMQNNNEKAEKCDSNQIKNKNGEGKTFSEEVHISLVHHGLSEQTKNSTEVKKKQLLLNPLCNKKQLIKNPFCQATEDSAVSNDCVEDVEDLIPTHCVKVTNGVNNENGFSVTSTCQEQAEKSSFEENDRENKITESRSKEYNKKSGDASYKITEENDRENEISENKPKECNKKSGDASYKITEKNDKDNDEVSESKSKECNKKSGDASYKITEEDHRGNDIPKIKSKEFSKISVDFSFKIEESHPSKQRVSQTKWLRSENCPKETTKRALKYKTHDVFEPLLKRKTVLVEGNNFEENSNCEDCTKDGSKIISKIPQNDSDEAKSKDLSVSLKQLPCVSTTSEALGDANKADDNDVHSCSTLSICDEPYPERSLRGEECAARSLSGEACPGRDCANLGCEATEPALLNESDPRLADYDSILFEETEVDSVPCCSEAEGNSNSFQSYLPFSDNYQVYRYSVKQMLAMKWPVHQAEVQFLATKPSLEVLHKTKNLISGYCKSCALHFKYSYLKWDKKTQFSKSKIPICPNCLEDGKIRHISLCFRMKFVVKDKQGTELEIMTTKRNASDFLGVTLLPYQGDADCRKTLVNRLSSLINSNLFFKIKIERVITQINIQYHMYNMTLQNLLKSIT